MAYDLMDMLDYIYQYWQENYCSPSIRDIVANTAWSSTSSARYALDKLERDGAIIKSGAASRNIVPTGVVKAIDSYWSKN